jgi:hypothetical protein
MGGSYGAFLNYIIFYKQGASPERILRRQKMMEAPSEPSLYRHLIEADFSNTSRIHF